MTPEEALIQRYLDAFNSHRPIAINAVAGVAKTFEADQIRRNRCGNILGILDGRHRIILTADYKRRASDAGQVRQQVECL